jgi:hypothetical protein
MLGDAVEWFNRANNPIIGSELSRTMHDFAIEEVLTSNDVRHGVRVVVL